VVVVVVVVVVDVEEDVAVTIVSSGDSNNSSRSFIVSIGIADEDDRYSRISGRFRLSHRRRRR
jgi:hypothetical protein